MAAVVIIGDEHSLRIERVIETNLIRVSYHCISCYFNFNIPFKNGKQQYRALLHVVLSNVFLLF